MAGRLAEATPHMHVSNPRGPPRIYVSVDGTCMHQSHLCALNNVNDCCCKSSEQAGNLKTTCKIKIKKTL